MPSGGWGAMVGQRATRTGGRRNTGTGSGARVSCGRARARATEPHARRALRSWPTARRAAGGGRAAAALAAGGALAAGDGRWSGCALRGWADERTGAADDAALGRAAAAG